MVRKLNSLYVKSKRALYLLQNGGPRALLSGLRRHHYIQKTRLQHRQVNEISVPESVSNDRFEKAAKIQAEEIVIFAGQPFTWLGGHHRPAQLALAALCSGHRVIYVCAHIFDPASTPPGMVQLSLTDTTVDKLFARLSVRAVIFNFLEEPAVLPFIERFRASGLSACWDAISLLQLPMAASYTFFDAYREYAQPSQLKGDSRIKAMILAPGGEALIDWEFLVSSAEMNPQIAFFLLGLANPPLVMPVNVVVLPSDCLRQANAFIAHGDFVLAPLRPESLSADAALQGVFAGIFLNKPVISSQSLVLENMESLLYQPVPECLGDLVERFGPPHINDLFVAEHSWLARLEHLVPIASRHDVSVIILIHNNVNIIARCLATLLRHCAAAICEVIVVDNASTDGGAEFVERMFPQVKLVRNPENGCSSGRNLGVEQATGNYIAFFDSDQWFVGGSGFAEALAILENQTKIGAIGWNAGWFDSTRTDLGGMIADYCPNRAMNMRAILHGYRSDIGFLGTSGLFMRRTTFDLIEGFDTFYDPTCFEDTDLCFQIRLLGMDISFRDLSGIRHQPHQTTGADDGSKIYRKLFKRNAKYFKKKWKDYPEFFVDYKE